MINAVKSKLAAAVALASASALSFAATSPVEVLTENSANFLGDTAEVLYAGAGLVIGALLIAKLVNLVIRFFQRG